MEIHEPWITTDYRPSSFSIYWLENRSLVDDKYANCRMALTITFHRFHYH